MNVIPQAVKDGFVRLVAPIARGLIRAGVHPNAITTVGTLVIVAGGVAFGLGLVRWAGFLLLLSGVFDILDGQVARRAGQATPFGAFYDSTLDRIGESVLFTGIAVFFLRGGVAADRVVTAVLVAMVALAASLLVSYTRARAEGLGLACTVGIAARAERILLLGIPMLFFGAGRGGMLLFWIVAVLAAVTTVTVVQRIAHVARITSVQRDGDRRRQTAATRVTALRKGS